MGNNEIHIPGDVPNGSINEFVNNYDLVTHGSGRLMLFAGDQKIEHLNDDFYGEGIHEDDNEPEHLFKIADFRGGKDYIKTLNNIDNKRFQLFDQKNFFLHKKKKYLTNELTHNKIN